MLNLFSTGNAAPAEDDIAPAAIPVEAQPESLEERVLRLERWIGRFNMHLERDHRLSLLSLLLPD